MRLVCLLFIAVFALLPTGLAQTASKPGLVRNLQANFDGCGCYFRFWGTNPRSEKVMFVDWGGKSWMNIAGRDVELKLMKESREDVERVGSKWTRTMTVDDISVTSTYITTRLCSQNVKDCRFTDYDATFVVRKGKRNQTVKAFGWCGC